MPYTDADFDELEKFYGIGNTNSNSSVTDADIDELAKAYGIGKSKSPVVFTQTKTVPTVDKSYKSSILPISRDVSGNVNFDINAGIPGEVIKFGKSLLSGFTYPGDVFTGKASPYDTKRVLETASFGLPVNPAVRIGDKAIPGVATRLERNVPTTTELQQAGSSGYEKVFGNPDKNILGMDVHYSPNSLQELATNLDRNLYGKGIIPKRAPETYEILDQFKSPTTDPSTTVPLAGIHAARETLSDIALKNKGAEKVAATKFIKELDKFIENPPAEGVLAGPATAAGKEYSTARANYAAAKRSNAITGELDKAVTGVEGRANLGAAAAHSGQNIDNVIRQNVKNFLKNPKNLRGYNQEEINALKEVSEGSPSRNAVRIVGNLLGGGLGLGATFLGGGAAGYGVGSGSPIATVIGAGLPVVGFSFRQAANALTKRSLAKADEKIRMRSPLFEQAGAGKYAPSTAPQSNVLRSIVLGSPEAYEPNDHSE